MCVLVARVVSNSAKSELLSHQAPLSMGFSKQEYWNELPFPTPGDLPNPGTEPGSLTLQADSLPSEPPGKPPNRQKGIFKLEYIRTYSNYKI